MFSLVSLGSDSRFLFFLQVFVIFLWFSSDFYVFSTVCFPFGFSVLGGSGFSLGLADFSFFVWFSKSFLEGVL